MQPVRLRKTRRSAVWQEAHVRQAAPRGADREEDALAMQKQMTGTGVTVRYDPGNPDVSILEDRRILGRRLTQNPHWLP
jgi:hypothetical protein